MKQPENCHVYRDFSALKFNGEWGRYLVAGGIAFPRWDERKEVFRGCLCVAVLGADNVAKVLALRDFGENESELLSRVGEFGVQYGCGKFYYVERDEDDANAVRMVLDGAIRKRVFLRIIDLVPVPYQTEYHLTSPLAGRAGSGKLLFDAEEWDEPFAEWDEKNSIFSAPLEIQALCACLFGIDRDYRYFRRRCKIW